MVHGTKFEKYDFSKDGQLSPEEIEFAKAHIYEERMDRRQTNQRKMAWVALFSMIIFTIMLFMPFVPDDRIVLLKEISTLFYIAQAGIVGAYMGASAMMNNRNHEYG
jgi:hypothetical protein